MLNRTWVLFNGQYCRQNEDLKVGSPASAIIAETLVFITLYMHHSTVQNFSIFNIF